MLNEYSRSLISVPFLCRHEYKLSHFDSCRVTQMRVLALGFLGGPKRGLVARWVYWNLPCECLHTCSGDCRPIAGISDSMAAHWLLIWGNGISPRVCVILLECWPVQNCIRSLHYKLTYNCNNSKRYYLFGVQRKDAPCTFKLFVC